MAGIFDLSAPGGIFGGRRTRRMREAAELARRETIGGIDIGVDELIASTADPDEAAAWRDQFESNKAMALSQDETLQREGLDGLASMATAVREAVERRKGAQQTFITEHARELRTRYQKAVEPMRELQANMGQIDALLSDPEFNQNMALNRGYLLDLLNGSTRQMLSDPEDFADALMGAGGGGLIGSLVSLAGGAMAAEDFNFTKDDYGKIARAMYAFNEKRYAETVQPLELEAAALEEAAGGLDFLPPGYSLTRFVTGSPETFENPLREDYGAGPQPAVRAPDSLGDVFGSLAEPQAATEPESATATFGGVREDALTWLDRTLGADTVALELKAQLAQLAEQGATVRADPASGGLYAFYSDGRREPVNTTTVQRSIVRRSLQAAGRPEPEVPRGDRLSGVRNWARGFSRRVGAKE